MIIPRNCDECNREYAADTRELNRGNGMYCSRNCSSSANSKKKEASRGPNWFNESCAYCSTPVHVTSKRANNSKSGLFFCSRSHQAKGFSDPSIAVRSGPTKDPNPRRSKCLTQQCETKTENPYCRSCRTDRDISAWLNGDNTVSWISTTREPKPWVKKYLLTVRGDMCEVCGYDKKRPDGTSKIQMDHIDGDYTNNSLDNLKLLCPNCHEDTPTYGSKNSSGGRRYRLASTLNRTIKP